MPAKDHYAYAEEAERLEYTLKYVDRDIDSSKEQKLRIDDEVAKGKRHFDSSDSASYTGLMVNTMLQDRLNLRLKNLGQARSRPYFARIDFREEGKNTADKLYIGKMVLIRDSDQELIIVDWRAPIANLYYESRLGDAVYSCPDGDIKGELSLKRQFGIDSGKLHDIFDIDITTNDEFLQTYLGANADNRLKDIVSTIQVEQNRIIRADMWKPLIVQGAAGSGKTTIALHRIAYLIYTYEKRFRPENFMIIAPNRLFLNYISSVLPELGVEKVRQTTFEDFAAELIGKRLKMEDPNGKMIMFLGGALSDEEKRIARMDSGLKSSMAFKDILDDYLSVIEESYIPKADFKVASTVIFDYREINGLFTVEYKDQPLLKRIKEIKKHLTNRLKRMKDGIVGDLQADCDRTVAILKNTMEEGADRQRLIAEAIDNKDLLVSEFRSTSKTAVKDYVSAIGKPDPLQYYKDLISGKSLWRRFLGGRVDDAFVEPLRCFSKGILDSGRVEEEDLAPIIYLKLKIYGMDERIPVKHIVIDEGQDFSIFQLYVIKNIIKDSSFTILGDLCQGIHSYRGINDWRDVERDVFGDSRVEVLTLEQSYRTTVEIMDAANSVLKCLRDDRLPLGRPVIRHGEKVRIRRRDDEHRIAISIEEDITELKAEGYGSVAVICKTMDESARLYGMMGGSAGGLYIIRGSEREYAGGTVVVPSYLAKGLEFDAVIIAGADDKNYKECEIDGKLLYVSMTRPLHRLYLYYSGTISPLLKHVE